MPASVAERVRALGHIEEVASGATIIARGSSETHLFVVERGEVEVLRDDDAHTALRPGDLIGEMAFLDNAPRRNDVVATRPSHIRRIERLELVTAFASTPSDLQTVLASIANLRAMRLSTEDALAESAADFVASLSEEALRHRAVRHPYLRALAEGALPDTRWALADFACQYYGYSSHFPRYLTTVISRLENPAHRRALLANLTEESGVYNDAELDELAKHGVERAWIEGIPHPVLFRRFSEAIGVDRGAEAEADQVISSVSSLEIS